ncbi:Transcriptional activatory protein BadR [Bacillus subtilis]|uniref:MarR family winged helix-turn-helix transcriptional regulator n=1 Tax=Bacillus subtilis TaxID=1423 RepID=UPI0006A8C36D|nr:MarR family winged helix-turn-helix transcriptional regulator [Bacillus subtilis]CUB20506.1 Transcriptional activatory protein BadR [Bacillus subtilis]CUB47956.1 Transcriptional activatory protein BadR [Bacillus subtilis]CUB57475.1 Transcriptional activatory protein BadR [Bacillus subtilis]
MDSKVKIIMNLLRTSTLLNRTGLKLVEGTNLASVQQWQLLGIIDRNEGISLAKLCDETLVTKQNITGLVERLRKAGLITTWTDSNDKRITRVGITSKGKETMEEMKPRTEMSNNTTFAEFSKEELDLFDNMLERLVNTLLLESNVKRGKKE